MANGVESELKFVFPPNALPAVRAALGHEKAGSPNHLHLISRYFDTADDYLWRHGTTLRVRKEGRHSKQTIKREQPSALERDEYETEADGETPNLDAFDATPLARLVRKPKMRDRLQCNFEVEVEREASTLSLHGSEIEAALDRGEVRCEGALIPFVELELELKSGERTELFELARRLCAAAPIALNLISKAERGRLLADGAWGHAFKGRPPKFKRRMNCAEAFQLACHSCLHDFIVNMQALESPDRVEALHQGRVALRRLRAALQLFKPMVEDRDFQRFDDELKWISHVFGEARDLDVFQDNAFEPAAKSDDNPGAAELAKLTGAKRDGAHEAVNAAVASLRLRLLLVELSAWIEEGTWRWRDRGAQEPIEPFARRALKKQLRKFVKRARPLATLDPAERHKVRIKAKKLRYMANFFKSAPRLVAARKRLRRLLARLERMQNCLGELHDEQAMAEFLVEAIRNLPAGADPLIGYAAGQLAQPAGDSKRRLAAAVKAYRAVAESRPF
ncbi:CHAD domain-containing protein [Methylocystis sp. JAN1]|uniref:CYTH and CHAD domain-containing protein n=1 Tax=Methylocystis sp. JAN1 TaxID=3397211 RepID=UPI003FA33767